VIDATVKRLECRISDHRPVYGRFTLKIKTLDQEQLKSTERSAYNVVDGAHQNMVHEQQVKWVSSALSLSQEDARQVVARANGDLRSLFPAYV
jgi:hypothetical protein